MTDVITQYTCRYHVTANLGQGHLVLGKVCSTAELTADEEAAIADVLSEANIKQGKLYHRVLINRVLYTSSSYHRCLSATDNVFCFVEGAMKFIGCAQKYVSVCSMNCNDCSAPCHHFAIVESLQILECQIVTDTISGSTTEHHHRVSHSRYSVWQL